jgi:hypothetical protein
MSLGVLLALLPLGGLLGWEWSCVDEAWASPYRVCDFWTKGPQIDTGRSADKRQ